jgi:hypothetical protein
VVTTPDDVIFRTPAKFSTTYKLSLESIAIPLVLEKLAAAPVPSIQADVPEPTNVVTTPLLVTIWIQNLDGAESWELETKIFPSELIATP